MIGVVVARDVEVDSQPAWDIDTWLMSCRVLGRKVEQAMLNTLMAAASASGVRTITAQYVPTPKNGMVSEHFDKLGFRRTGEGFDGRRLYRLETAAFEPAPTPFSSRRTRMNFLDATFVFAFVPSDPVVLRDRTPVRWTARIRYWC